MRTQERALSSASIKKGFYFLLTTQTLALFLFTCLALSIFACSYGGYGRSPSGSSSRFKGMSVDELLSRMKERLNLSEEQVEQIHPILENDIQKRCEIIQKYRGQGWQGMQSMREEMQELDESVEAQLSKYLTDEQMEEYRKIQEEQRQRMRERKERPHGRFHSW